MNHITGKQAVGMTEKTVKDLEQDLIEMVNRLGRGFRNIDDIEGFCYTAQLKLRRAAEKFDAIRRGIQ